MVESPTNIIPRSLIGLACTHNIQYFSLYFFLLIYYIGLCGHREHRLLSFSSFPYIRNTEHITQPFPYVTDPPKPANVPKTQFCPAFQVFHHQSAAFLFALFFYPSFHIYTISTHMLVVVVFLLLTGNSIPSSAYKLPRFVTQSSLRKAPSCHTETLFPSFFVHTYVPYILVIPPLHPPRCCSCFVLFMNSSIQQLNPPLQCWKPTKKTTARPSKRKARHADQFWK